MDPTHLAIIWSLVVMLGGFGITGYLLWRDRDHDQPAVRRRPAPADMAATLARWQDRVRAARAYTERHSSKPESARAPKVLCLADTAAYGACVRERGHAGPHEDAMGFTFLTDDENAVSLARWYAAREEYQRQQLYDAGMATWH